MQTLVAENTFRPPTVEKPKPGTFEQARKVSGFGFSTFAVRNVFSATSVCITYGFL